MKLTGVEKPKVPTTSRPPLLLARVLRLVFDLLYNQLAWTYEAVAWIVSLGQWSTWRMCAIPFLQPGTVLEIGHGTGELAVQLARQGRQVVALDLSSSMGRLARRRLTRGRAHTGPNNTVCLVQASAMQLPFPARHFDNLVSTFPTDYIFEAEALHEAHRVMRPGGPWVIIPLAQLVPKGPGRRLFAELFRVTGQTPAWDCPLAQALRLVGFHVHQEILTLGGSFVHVTVATKPKAGNPGINPS